VNPRENEFAVSSVRYPTLAFNSGVARMRLGLTTFRPTPGDPPARRSELPLSRMQQLVGAALPKVVAAVGACTPDLISNRSVDNWFRQNCLL
jgi:hypothetical protein